MRDYVILTDSSCDLPPALARALGVEALPLTVTIGGGSYLATLDWQERSAGEFYAKLRDGEQARTSAVAPESFLSALAPALDAGKDALILVLASALSRTYESAKAAQDAAVMRWGNRVEVIDTRSASLGEGLLVYLAARARAGGMDLSENAAQVKRLIPHLCHWFTVGDPRFLKRGGRLSASAAQQAGERLHIMPVMRMDGEGRLVGSGRVRGRKAAIRSLAERLAQEATDLSTQTVFISHGDCAEDAEELKSLSLALGAQDVVVGPVGPVIGAHSGPGTLAIFFIGTQRM